MSNIVEIKTKVFRGCGFMTIAKYNNKGNIIYVGDKESKKITAIETENYSVVRTFEGHNGVIWSLDTSSDDSILISCSGDMSVIIWDTCTGNILKQLNIKNIPKFVSIQKNSNKNLLVIYCEAISKRLKSYVNIYSLNELIEESLSGEKLDILIDDNLNNDKGLIKSIEWTFSSKPTVMQWINQNSEIISKLLIGCEDGTIIVKDIITDEEKIYKFHTDSIKSIVFDKTNNKFLTSSLDKTSKQINLETFEVLKTYESTVPINYAIYNFNDRKIILAGGIEAMMIAKTGDNDLNIKFYRANDQKLINHMASHFGPVRYLEKSSNNKNFLSASQDGMLKIYMMDDEDDKPVDDKPVDDKPVEEPIDEVNNEQIKKDIEFDKYDDNYNLEDNKRLYKVNLTNEINRLEYVNIKVNKVKKEEITKKIIVGMPEYKSYIESKNIKRDEFEKEKIIEKSSTIKINNLPNDVRAKELLDIYEFFGRITERGINIKNYKENTIAFIKYTTNESALKAIDATNCKKFGYCVLSVELANN
jgi:translation initiation factor 3 subunit I